jgi:hypothetical protein
LAHKNKSCRIEATGRGQNSEKDNIEERGRVKIKSSINCEFTEEI